MGIRLVGVRALQPPLRMLDAQGVVTGPRHVDRLPAKLGPGHQGAAIPDRGQTGLRLDPVKLSSCFAVQRR